MLEARTKYRSERVWRARAWEEGHSITEVHVLQRKCERELWWGSFDSWTRCVHVRSARPRKFSESLSHLLRLIWGANHICAIGISNIISWDIRYDSKRHAVGESHIVASSIELIGIKFVVPHPERTVACRSQDDFKAQQGQAPPFLTFQIPIKTRTEYPRVASQCIITARFGGRHCDMPIDGRIDQSTFSAAETKMISTFARRALNKRN